MKPIISKRQQRVIHKMAWDRGPVRFLFGSTVRILNDAWSDTFSPDFSKGRLTRRFRRRLKMRRRTLKKA